MARYLKEAERREAEFLLRPTEEIEYAVSHFSVDLNNIGPFSYRLGITFMAVDPNHQRQGVGSALMDMFCRTLDENELDAFVMSSPMGARLYSKFGFKAVGAIQTKQGNITSMLRPQGTMKLSHNE
jgi:predicted N-acetyltransferase YhbS